MKFKVTYKRVKKKKTVSIEATFFKIEDAFHWEQYVKEQGYQEVEVLPIF